MPLDFNLAHTDGLVVCAIASVRRIGVDAEHADHPRGDPFAIARHYFAPAEIAALARTPDARRRDAFLSYWTLKEAYLKARGSGLRLGLSRFWFEFDESRPRFVCEPGLDDDPAQWHFELLRIGVQHIVAVCVASNSLSAPVVVVRDASSVVNGYLGTS